MPQSTNPQIGIMFRRENPPESLPDFARHAEEIGISELWMVEDCFYASGIASAAIALAVTRSIPVGLGIMPAVARNAAFTAMEIATLARTYPGRFLAGIGHGMANWMKQIGAFPKSQLAALSETSEVVRRLLAGEEVTFSGDHVQLDQVKLEFPPTQIPPVLLGVRGPKSLMASGRYADGTLLAELASPAYVRWAREQITQGQADAGRTGTPHPIYVYMLFAVDADGVAARNRLRPMIADWLAHGNNDYTRALGIDAELDALRQSGGRAKIEAELPDTWIKEMTIAGTPDECRESIQTLIEAGAASVILVPDQLGLDGLNAVGSLLT